MSYLFRGLGIIKILASLVLNGYYDCFSLSPSPGNPNTPVFNSRVDSKTRTSYRLSWITESYATIDEYRLLYRKLPVSWKSLSWP